ncbi:MAG: glutamine amidotransferase [Planctomycetota bacterium]
MVRFSFYPIADSYLLVALIALLLLALLAIGPGRERLNSGRRGALLALRIGVIVLVILAMLRPTIVYTRKEKQPATLAVLADLSRSMTVSDSIGGTTRYEAMQRALAGAAGPLQRLADDFEVKIYGFDEATRPLEMSAGRVLLPEKPEGTQSAIGAALNDVLQQEGGKRLLGMLLLSDGAQRALAPRDLAPQTAAARMKPLGAPLFAVAFGQSRGLGQAQDVAVKDLVANATVFVNNELTVGGQIRIDGMVGREIPVRVLFETEPGKMTVVAEKKLQSTTDGQLLPVTLEFAPEQPGERKLTLEAADQTGELVTTNNRLSTFVNVLKGGLKVLYIEGQRRPEAKFLRRALDSSPDIKVDYLWIDAERPETRPGDLGTRLKPGEYDVYILGDIDSAAFEDGELADLAEAVNQGAGLIMLGGYHSFGPGGYARTPLRTVLPLRMDATERQQFGESPRADMHLPGPVKMRPSRFGRGHPVLTLSGNPQANQDLWDQLPPLLGANRFAGLAPGAIVLADDGRNPLLVTHNFGNGRVLAMAVDSTWRWWMRGFEPAYRRFWRQIVLWLAKRDQLGESSVWVRLEKRRFAPNERVEFRVGVLSAEGEAIGDAQFTVRTVPPSGIAETVGSLSPEGDQWLGAVTKTRDAGDYTIEVSAEKEGVSIGTTQARFLVFEQDLELDNAAADPSMMEGLAALTGGESLAPEQLPGLLERLLESTEELEIAQETKKSLWDKWPFFLALVALLGVEWFLRKRWGLV